MRVAGASPDESGGAREDEGGGAPHGRDLCPNRLLRPLSYLPSARPRVRLRATGRSSIDPREPRSGGDLLPARDSGPRDGGVAPTAAGEWWCTQDCRCRCHSRSAASGTAMGRRRRVLAERTSIRPFGFRLRTLGTPVRAYRGQPALRQLCRKSSGIRRWACPDLLRATGSPFLRLFRRTTRERSAASSSDRNRDRTPTWRWTPPPAFGPSRPTGTRWSGR